MAKIIILGAGAMSSAFAIPCIDNNHKAIVVGTNFDEKLINNINTNNNFHYGLNIKLPPTNLYLTLVKPNKLQELTF